MVECSDCDGKGRIEKDIEDIKLERDHPKHEELLALQDDVRRVTKQARTLTELKPDREESYQRQLAAVLVEINTQATALTAEE